MIMECLVYTWVCIHIHSWCSPIHAKAGWYRALSSWGLKNNWGLLLHWTQRETTLTPKALRSMHVWIIGAGWSQPITDSHTHCWWYNTMQDSRVRCFPTASGKDLQIASRPPMLKRIRFPAKLAQWFTVSVISYRNIYVGELYLLPKWSETGLG